MEAGQAYNIRAGCPNLIERIEGGLLSYGNEMTPDNNPFECGMAGYCDLGAGGAFMGQEAIENIRAEGHQREIRGISFDGALVHNAWCRGPCARPVVMSP